MFAFTELHALNGDPVMINLDKVTTIHSGEDKIMGLYTCFTFTDGKIARVSESYEDIASMFTWEDDEEEFE